MNSFAQNFFSVVTEAIYIAFLIIHLLARKKNNWNPSITGLFIATLALTIGILILQDICKSLIIL
jgi:hypothetical protein